MNGRATSNVLGIPRMALRFILSIRFIIESIPLLIEKGLLRDQFILFFWTTSAPSAPHYLEMHFLISNKINSINSLIYLSRGEGEKKDLVGSRERAIQPVEPLMEDCSKLLPNYKNGLKRSHYCIEKEVHFDGNLLILQ